MNTFFRRSSLLALATLAGSASAQMGAYEGFGYPAGSSLAGQSGGSGFSTPWQPAGYGDWQTSSQSLSSLRVWQLMQGQVGSAASSSGGLQRSLSSPITGATGSTVWISFIARHSGPTADSWLGLKLPCSGPGSDPFLFIGKPYGQSTWGIDNGVAGGVRSTSVPASNRVRFVAAITFRDGRDDVTLWTNPELGVEPALPSADLHLPAYASLSDLRKILIETGSITGEVSNAVDEIRIGSSYAEVTPVEAGVVLDGFKIKPAAGSSCDIVTAAGMGMGPHVRLASSSGSLECGGEIEMNTATGGGISINPGDFPPGGEMGIKHKKWDGIVNLRSTMTSSTDGLSLETEFSDSSVTSVRCVSTDSSGTVLQDQTTPGQSASIAPGGETSDPCPSGLNRVWTYMTVYYNPPLPSNGGYLHYHTKWVFACPEDTLSRFPSIDVYGMGTPVASDGGLGTLEVSSTGLSELHIGEPVAASHGTRCSGLGDVLLTEECDDGNDCDDASDRKITVRNIGSSGNDGVEIRWPASSPPSSGGVTLGDILDSGGEAEMSMKKNYVGHVTIMKQRVIGTGGGGGLVIPDYSEIGSPEFRMVAYRDGLIVRDEVLPGGTPIDIEAQIICGPGKQLVWGWVTMWVWNPWPTNGSLQTHWGVIGCMTVGVGGGNDPTYTDRVVFLPVNPQPVEDLGEVSITARNTSEIVLTEVGNPATAACNADFNQDGFMDFFDYDDFVLAFETGVGNADFNGDGFTDFFDYDDFVQAFETGC